MESFGSACQGRVRVGASPSVMSPLARTPPVSPVRPAGSLSQLGVMREQTQSQQKILWIFTDWREQFSSAFPGRCQPRLLLLPLPSASQDPAAGADFPGCQQLQESFPGKGHSWLEAATEQEWIWPLRALGRAGILPGKVLVFVGSSPTNPYFWDVFKAFTRRRNEKAEGTE